MDCTPIEVFTRLLDYSSQLLWVSLGVTSTSLAWYRQLRVAGSTDNSAVRHTGAFISFSCLARVRKQQAGSCTAALAQGKRPRDLFVHIRLANGSTTFCAHVLQRSDCCVQRSRANYGNVTSLLYPRITRYYLQNLLQCALGRGCGTGAAPVWRSTEADVAFPAAVPR